MEAGASKLDKLSERRGGVTSKSDWYPFICTNERPRVSTPSTYCDFACLFDSLRPISNLSIKQGRVFLG